MIDCTKGFDLLNRIPSSKSAVIRLPGLLTRPENSYSEAETETKEFCETETRKHKTKADSSSVNCNLHVEVK